MAEMAGQWSSMTGNSLICSLLKITSYYSEKKRRRWIANIAYIGEIRTSHPAVARKVNETDGFGDLVTDGCLMT